MDGRVYQVNISPGGVPKLPVPEARVGAQGLDGDAHHHDHVHGGPHRAVCLLALEAIERVQADGHRIEPGAVGENLTTTGIELATLDVGTRLAVGEEVVLEISGPANPCDVIKHVFVGGKSGRISILLHPTDSRMYARVLAQGTIHEGDAIRVLPPLSDSRAAVHRLLDLLESVEREAYVALWRAAAAAGDDIRILDRGDLSAAASPSLPGALFNRAFGMRQIPIALPEVRALFMAAGTTGYAVAGADEPPWPGAESVETIGVHTAEIEEVTAIAERTARPEGLLIRAVDPHDRADVDRWNDVVLAGFGMAGPNADAWRRLAPGLAAAKGQHTLLATLGGRDVAAASMFTRRRVGWLGNGTVLPDARGLGLQRALIAHRICAAGEAGCRRVMSDADVGSISAANLEALGLRRIWTNGLYRLDPGMAA
ncbi:MAG TPA: GNAT family N-acetyltransferase [Candidatus Limnocylindrales bacterium]